MFSLPSCPFFSFVEPPYEVLGDPFRELEKKKTKAIIRKQKKKKKKEKKKMGFPWLWKAIHKQLLQ